MNHFTYTLKKLQKRVASSLVIVVSLALGVAVNTLVFGWINSYVINPLPAVPNSQQLHSVTTVVENKDFIDSSFLDFIDYREDGGNLSSLLAYKYFPISAQINSQTHPIAAELVSKNYFQTLRLQPYVGRFFSVDDKIEKPGAASVVVISYGFWQQHFNGNEAALDTSITINGVSHTIIGVAPQGFNGLSATDKRDFWLPVADLGVFSGSANWIEDRKTRPFKMLLRVPESSSLSAIQSQLALVAQRLESKFPASNLSIATKVHPFMESPEGGPTEITALLVVLFVASFVVLGIISTNLINLALVQAIERSKEVSIRRAMGATTLDVIWIFLLEGLMLSVVASLLSLTFIYVLQGILVQSNVSLLMLSTQSGLLTPALIIYCAVITFIFGVSIITIPSLHLSQQNLATSLQESMRGSTTSRLTSYVRTALVIFQVMLAFLALACAGTFVANTSKIKDIPPGFNPEGVLLLNLSATSNIPDTQTLMSQVQRVRSGLNSMSEVQQVSYAEFAPLGGSGGSWEEIQIEGYTPREGENTKLYRNFVGEDYFSTMGISVVQGREFRASDDAASPFVTVVNQAFADRYFPNRTVLGRNIRGWGRDMTIVGVVANSKIDTLTEDAQPYFYVPFAQFANSGSNVIMHVKLQPKSTTDMQLYIQQVESQGNAMFVSWHMTLKEYMQGSMFSLQMVASLLSILGISALLLTSIGILGVVSRSANQRQQEVGIRMAMGATPFKIILLFMRQNLQVTVIGVLAGLAVYIAIWPSIVELLYNTSGVDLGLVIGVAMLILTVSLFAGLAPCIKASRLNPVDALSVH
ncbi:ABC transporter permease [Alteromonas sp. a30]|uniref:ABC transporter permease n=1 Tax=Alteromonas sp. a30 TaxID=2730917 RepID=UPI0022822272|nr:ABC transporter permease [Alteromonas sp. a30]MCY7294928.1 FtsX-like permease family protein [Alteromonas sp. a30]